MLWKKNGLSLKRPKRREARYGWSIKHCTHCFCGVVMVSKFFLWKLWPKSFLGDRSFNHEGAKEMWLECQGCIYEDNPGDAKIQAMADRDADPRPYSFLVKSQELFILGINSLLVGCICACLSWQQDAVFVRYLIPMQRMINLKISNNLLFRKVTV